MRWGGVRNKARVTCQNNSWTNDPKRGPFKTLHTILSSQFQYQWQYFGLKGLYAYSSDPWCKAGNPGSQRFPKVPLKLLSDEVRIRFQCLQFWKLFFFNSGFSTKVTCAFLLQENIKTLSLRINHFKP